VHELFLESDLPVPIISDHANNSNRLCCIFSHGTLPTKSITEKQIESYRNMAQFDGYHVWVNPDVVAVEQAGWVIGVEGIPLFEAATKGVKTSLIATGIGAKFYQAMFPKLKVLKMFSNG